MFRLVVIVMVFGVLARVYTDNSENIRERISWGRKSPRTVTADLQDTTCIGCTGTVLVTNEENSNNIEDINEIVEEDALTALRVEYIKNQILKKLRRKEKPLINADGIPNLITENANIMPKLLDEDDHYSDDFYAKTTRAVILPYEDAARCIRKIRYPSACIPFQMSSDLNAADVSTAELWFYKVPDRLDSHNQTFVIYEVAHWDSNKSFQKNQPLAIKETSSTEGWLKVDVSYVVKNWLQFQDTPTHAINVVCKTCGNDKGQSPIAYDGNKKPFLIIYTNTSQEKKKQTNRNKRQTNCGPDSNECCRENLYISFADIGWNDWVIQPAGYNAYFCKGSCATAASLVLTGSQHNHIIQKVMWGNNHKKPTRTKLELKPCCAPTSYKPLQILLMNNNKTITSVVLPKMIVESCGCM